MPICPRASLPTTQTTADVAANDQLLKAEDYRPLIVGYHNGAAIKLSDIANVQDSVENIRAAGFVNGKPSVLLIIFRQPGANIIETVDRVRQALPSLKASIPCGHRPDRRDGPDDDDPRVGPRRGNHAGASRSSWSSWSCSSSCAARARP